MSSAIGIALFIGLLVGYSMYASWLTKGIRLRRLRTAVPAEDVRHIFMARVTGLGWTVIDEGNPMVARSPIASGPIHRQEISCQIEPLITGGCEVAIWPSRATKRVLGTYTKAHTLRIRMNRVIDEIRARDPQAIAQTV